MNIVIDDLTNYPRVECLQSRHNTGAHSWRAIGSFRWTQDSWLLWAEVIRELVLQDKAEKKDCKVEERSSDLSTIKRGLMMYDHTFQHVEAHSAQ